MMPVERSLESRALTSTWPKWFSGVTPCGAAETQHEQSETLPLKPLNTYDRGVQSVSTEEEELGCETHSAG